MKYNTLKITAKIVSTYIATVLLTVTSFAKIFRAPLFVNHFAKLGLVTMMPVLGIVTLCLTVFFLLPKTRKAGFLILGLYMSGAVVVDIANHAPAFPAALILVLVMVSGYLRTQGLFRLSPVKTIAVSKVVNNQ